MMMMMRLMLMLMMMCKLTVAGETGLHGDHAVHHVVKASRSDTGDVTVLIHSTQVVNVLAVILTDDLADWTLVTVNTVHFTPMYVSPISPLRLS